MLATRVPLAVRALASPLATWRCVLPDAMRGPECGSQPLPSLASTGRRLLTDGERGAAPRRGANCVVSAGVAWLLAVRDSLGDHGGARIEEIYPASLLATVGQFCEWLAIRNYSPRTITGFAERRTALVHWCGGC